MKNVKLSPSQDNWVWKQAMNAGMSTEEWKVMQQARYKEVVKNGEYPENEYQRMLAKS